MSKPNQKQIEAKAKTLSKFKKAGEIQFIKLDKKKMGVSIILAPDVELADIIGPVHDVLEDMIKFYNEFGPSAKGADFCKQLKAQKLN